MSNKLNRLLAIGTFLIGFGSVTVALHHGQQVHNVQQSSSSGTESVTISDKISNRSATDEDESAKSKVQSYQSQLTELLITYVEDIKRFCIEAVESIYTVKLQETYNTWNGKLQSLIDDYYTTSELASHLTEALTFFTKGSEELASTYKEAMEIETVEYAAKTTIVTYQSDLAKERDMYIEWLSALGDFYLALCQNCYDVWYEKLQLLVDTYSPIFEIHNHLDEAGSFFTSGSEELANIYAAARSGISKRNDVLSEVYNYNLYKDINFVDLIVDGVLVDGIDFDRNLTTEEFLFNGYAPFRCITAGLPFLWQSVGNIEWASDYGLRNTGSGPRGLHIDSLSRGQILVIRGKNGGYNTAGSDVEYNGFCIPNGYRYGNDTNWIWEYTNPLIVEDISDEIHAIQNAATSTHDQCLYLQVMEDGVLNIPLERNASIQGFQIWTAADTDFDKTYTLSVQDESGKDLSSKVSICWYDGQGKELGRGTSIGGVKKDTELYYSVSLDESLGKVYREVPKQKVNIEEQTIVCQLNKIEEVALHGKVRAYGIPLPRVEVNIIQWLNGRYEYSTGTLTDANGDFTLNAYNDSTELTVFANGYIDNKTTISNLNNGGDLGIIEMMEVRGKVIAINLGYQEATKEGNEPNIQNWYSDTRNIDYKVQNLTKGVAITDYGIQQGNIVLPVGVDRGDKIRITANSLNKKFAEVAAEGVIADNDTANINITLLAFGGIEAVYNQKADENLLAMLYDCNGKLQMRTVCSSHRLTFTNLDAGSYYLVTMGYNGAIGSVADLSDLASMDLYEGTDYVKNIVTVRDGYIASVNVASVPELDVSKFEYTGINTSYMPNKTQLVTGNFITLTARLDFKEQYVAETDNAKMVIEIPEGCEFVPNSVVIGAKAIPHSLNGNRLTITVDKEDLDSRIRFCVIPTQTGTFLTTAYAEFDYKGTKTQPMGQIMFEATSGELYVPSTTRTSTVMLGGIGVPKAEVEVYDNEKLIGMTKSLSNGKWSLSCELANPYNLSTHNIYIKYRGEGNVVGKTESKSCFYDINAIVPKTVTMVNTAHPAGDPTPRVYETVFDYETVMSVNNYYLYWPDYPDFTFLIDLSENDTTKVFDVNLYVYTTDGDKRKLPAVYDGKLNRFVATSSFDMHSLPVNVSVDMSTSSTPLLDRDYLTSVITQKDSIYSEYLSQEGNALEIGDSINELLEQDEIDFNAINSLFVQLGENSSFLSDEERKKIQEMSDEEWDAYIESYIEPFDTDALLDGFNLTKQYFETDNGNGSISYETCDGLIESELEGEGYLKMPTESGDYIYLYSSDCFFCLVDFANNIVIKIENNIDDAEVASFYSPRRKANGMSDIQSMVSDIVSNVDKVVSIVSGFQQTYAERIIRQQELVSKYIERRLLFKTKIDGVPWWDASHLEDYLRYYDRYGELSKRELDALNHLRRFEQIASFLEKIANGISIISTVFDGYQMIKDLQDWERVIASINAPCDEAKFKTSELQKEARRYSDQIMGAYGVVLAADMVGIAMMIPAISATLMTAGGALPSVLINIGCITASMLAEHFYIERSDGWKNAIKNRIKDLEEICKKEEPDDDYGDWDNDNDDMSSYNNDYNKLATENQYPIHDPSGYVYEAVPTNRIEGVKSTVYYRDDNSPVLWDASEYGQINPQITEEDGLYAWDVPQGMWKVVFEKEEYETVQTDWLPVPPPQLEVNIPMSHVVAPFVENVIGSESGITLTFSKYMKPNTLTKSGQVSVTSNGTNVKGKLELVNMEENPLNNEVYVSKIKFVPNTPFNVSDDVIITVKKEVESYANKQMMENFVQRVDIESEIKEFVYDSLITVDYHGTGVIELSLLPKTAANGRTVQVASLSPMIASVDASSVTLDEEGKAHIVVSGELPGSTSIRFSMPEVGIEKYAVVNVAMSEIEVKAPKASKLNGSTFEDSYLLSLSCATKGATIYYTIDGSCPCDEQKRIKYTKPIALPVGQITLKAIAIREGLGESDVAEYTYTIVKNEVDGIQIVEENHNFDCCYQDGYIVVSGAKGASCRIYDLQGRELGNRSRLGSQSRINVPKSDVYLVSVQFNDQQTVVHKIMAR